MTRSTPSWDWAHFQNVAQGDLLLRLATDADFPFVQEQVCHPTTLQALHETPEYAEATLKSLWAEGLDAPEMRHLIIESTHLATPAAYLRLLYPFQESQCLWLSYIVVASALRGQGYGRSSLQLLLAAAKSTGCVTKFGVHTLASNARAVHLYESSGFQCTRREPWQTADGTSHERLTFCQVLDQS